MNWGDRELHHVHLGNEYDSITDARLVCVRSHNNLFLAYSIDSIDRVLPGRITIPKRLKQFPVRLFDRPDFRFLCSFCAFCACCVFLRSKHRESSRFDEPKFAVKRRCPHVRSQNFEQVLNNARLFQLWLKKRKHLRGDSTSTIPGNHRGTAIRSEEHTSELQSLAYLVCRLLL